MTFKIQDYNQLKKKYNEITAEFLAHHKVNSIEELKENRRYPLKFIGYVIDELDTQNAEQEKKHRKGKKPKPACNQAETLTAAMLLMRTIINESLGIPSLSFFSRLRDLIDNALEINEDLTNTLDFYRAFKQLNAFLQLIYTHKDSRNGINPHHRFQYIPIDFLATYIERSYQIEQEKCLKIVAGFKKSEQAPNEQEYEAEKVSASSLKDIPAWKELTQQLAALDLEEQKRKKVSKTEDTGIRAPQLLLIKKVAESLETTSFKEQNLKCIESHKRAILAGTMYLVHEQISKSYNLEALSTADCSSFVHKSLSQILHVKAESQTPETIHELVKAALQFISVSTLDNSNAAIKKSHIFTDIKDFSLIDILSLSKSMLIACQVNALKNAVAIYSTQLAEQKAREEELGVQQKAPSSSDSQSSGWRYINGLFFSKPVELPAVDKTLCQSKEILKAPNYEEDIKKLVHDAPATQRI